MVARLGSFNHIKYSQGDQLRALGDAIKQRSDVGGGICLSLCCQWMELHRKYHQMGGGERDRIDAMAIRIRGLMSDREWFHRAMGAQAGEYAEVYKGETKRIDRKNATGKKFGISFSNETQHRYVRHLAEAVDVKRGYVQTSFSFKARGGGGRHAICSYKSGGKIFGLGAHLYVFDPNYGEFRIPTGQIREFFDSLLNSYAAGGIVFDIFTYHVENGKYSSS